MYQSKRVKNKKINEFNSTKKRNRNLFYESRPFGKPANLPFTFLLFIIFTLTNLTVELRRKKQRQWRSHSGPPESFSSAVMSGGSTRCWAISGATPHPASASPWSPSGSTSSAKRRTTRSTPPSLILTLTLTPPILLLTENLPRVRLTI